MPLDPPRIEFCTRRTRASKAVRSGRAGLAAGGAVALVAASAGVALAAPALPAGWLREGSRGPAVGELQRALHLRKSEVFNRRTEGAVLTFQRRHNLGVDGIVGPQTWDALFHIQAAPAANAAPAGSSTGGVAPEASASQTSGYSIPSSIVDCESGGNYSAFNPGSGAGGAYQILPSTWRAFGGQGLPQDASPAEQNRIAAEIYASQGASAWSC